MYRVHETGEAPKLQQFRKMKAASAFPNLRWNSLKLKAKSASPALGNPWRIGQPGNVGDSKNFRLRFPHASLCAVLLSQLSNTINTNDC